MDLIEKIKEIGIVDNADSSRAVAETLGQMSIAKKFPRDMKVVEEKLKKICNNQSFAESAYYSQKRGDKEIIGPSIRLAEAVVYCLGNINYGINAYPDEEDKNATKYVVFAIDLENNTRIDRSFVRKHIRTIKGKNIPVTSPQAQYELVASDAARRLRACIFNIVPKYLTDMAKEICKKALATPDETPIETKIERMLTAFLELGISKNDIEGRLGKEIDSIKIDDLIKIRGLYNAIVQGYTTKDEIFPANKSIDKTIENVETPKKTHKLDRFGKLAPVENVENTEKYKASLDKIREEEGENSQKQTKNDGE